MQAEKQRQYMSVGILGVCFLLVFTAFNSLQNMISSLYKQEGYNNLGLIALFCIYGTFGVATFFASYVIDRISYRKLMFACSLGYLLFELSGLVVTVCEGSSKGVCGPGVIYTTVVSSAVVCGVSASFIWVAQAAYVSDISSPTTKVELFGLFWGLMMASQIFGNIFGTFLLGKVSSIVYFIALCGIGTIGTFLFLFVRPSGKETHHLKEPDSLKDKLAEMKELIMEPGSWPQKLYYVFIGMVIACYAGFLFKLIDRSYKQSEGQSDADYKKDLKFHTGLVFILMGVSQVLTSLIMNRVGDRFNKYRMASFGTMIVEVAAVISLLTYFLESYWMCFFCSALWGASEAFLQSNTGALISIEYEGKVAAFSVFRVFFSLGVCATLLLNIILTEAGVPDWVFIIIVVAYQSVVAVTSQQLEGRFKKYMKASVLTEELNS